MILLDNTTLARRTEAAVPDGARVLCVIQDRRPGWEHLALCVAVRCLPGSRLEYVVWKINLETHGAFSGKYTDNLRLAWDIFTKYAEERLGSGSAFTLGELIEADDATEPTDADLADCLGPGEII